MKKLLSYLLILLANVALIGHAVIPHHHHSSLCAHQKVGDHQHEVCNVLGEHNHSHDEEGTDCILGDTRVVLTKPLKNGKPPVFSLTQPKACFNATKVHSLEDNIWYTCRRLKPLPDQKISSATVLPGIGLRAPPSV